MGRNIVEVVYYVAVSLDGYIAGADGSVEWLAPFEADNEDYGYKKFYESVDALLMGSRTYEQVLSFGAWPYEGKSTLIFSRKELETSQKDVFITANQPHEILSDLGKRNITRTWLVGGGELAASFRENRLITEYIFSFMPVYLGEGIPLFSTPSSIEYLNLEESQSYQNGVIQVRYLPLQHPD